MRAINLYPVFGLEEQKASTLSEMRTVKK